MKFAQKPGRQNQVTEVYRTLGKLHGNNALDFYVNMVYFALIRFIFVVCSFWSHLFHIWNY